MLLCVYLLRRAVKAGHGRQRLAVLLCALLFAVGCETFLFNFNFYRSHGYEPEELSSPVLRDAFVEDGCVVVADGGSLEYTGIGRELKNIYINAPDGNYPFEVSFYYTDEANAGYMSTVKRTVYPRVDGTKYINLDFLGDTDKLRINISTEYGAVYVSGVSVNVNRGFNFSLLRVLLMAAVPMILWLLRSESPIYKKRYIGSEKALRPFVAAALAVTMSVMLCLTLLCPSFVGISLRHVNSDLQDCKGIDFVSVPFKNHMQYYELAESLCEGKTWLKEEVPDSLKELANPYDPAARAEASEKTGDSYRWDSAYFNGHYYVYFGIVPELIFYLPFYIVTGGEPFPTAIGVFMGAAAFAVGAYFLVAAIIRRFFKEASAGAYLLLSFALTAGAGIIFLAKRADFYAIPIMTGTAFTVWGLYLWISALDNRRGRLLRLVFGSLCMALAVGCRPQLALVSAAALPLFWNMFFNKQKYIITRKGITDIILLAAPFVVVAAGLMYYNYIRFGSPFDFGASYNLTTNDVTHRGWNIGRVGLALFMYLFKNPKFTAVFPFLESAQLSTNYMGRTVSEYTFGGVIATAPFLWIILFINRFKEELKKNKAAAVTAVFIAIGVLLAVLDGESGGILQRYMSDFSYIFFIAAVFVMLAAEERFKKLGLGSAYAKMLLGSVCFTALYSALLVLVRADITLDTENPTLFYTLSELVQFWL